MEISTRDDIVSVGEIKPDSGFGDGDVFIIGTIFDGKLFLLLRCFNSKKKASGRGGIITDIDEYAWLESGITFYIRDVMNIALDVGEDTNWATDYFKYRIVNGQIIFDIYDDKSGKRKISTTTGDNNPTLQFDIEEKRYDVCTFLNADTSDSRKYWFQPRFKVQAGGFTFGNELKHYPGCAGKTKIFYPDTSRSCKDDQNDDKSRSQSLFTDSPPGLDRVFTSDTKLWTGVEYYTDVDAQVYTSKSGAGKNNNTVEDEKKTRMFGQEMYYLKSGNIPSNSGSAYGGLPKGTKKVGGDGSQSGKSVRFFINGSGTISCGGLASEHIKTKSGDKYNETGFNFFLIPIRYLERKDCNRIVENPVYNYCPTASRDQKNFGKDLFFQNFCGKNLLTGYTNLDECQLNAESLPYYYSKNCEVGEKVISAGCGSTYDDNFNPPGGVVCKIPTKIKFNSLFGERWDSSTVTYSNEDFTQTNCCYRPFTDAPPRKGTDANSCSINLVCEGMGNQVGCNWLADDGSFICNNDGDDPDDCKQQCIKDGSNPTGCRTVTCNEFNLPEGCINECTRDVTDDSNCYFKSDDGNNWICKEGDKNFPPGCRSVCTGNNDPLNCLNLECNDNGLPSNCLKDCISENNPTGCSWKDGDNKWICEEGSNGTFPKNCKNPCTPENVNGSVFCENVQCNGNFRPDGCIDECDAGGNPEGCLYKSGDSWICQEGSNGNFPKNCINICTRGTDNSDCDNVICEESGFPPGCITRCDNLGIPDGPNDGSERGCSYNIDGEWICEFDENGNILDFPKGCKPVCTSENQTNCVSAISATCNDYPNLDNCLDECGIGQEPGEDHVCNYFADEEWICDDNGFPEGCVNICDEDNDPENCKRITCIDENNSFPPNCFPKIDVPVEPCTSENDPEGCVWQIKVNNTDRFICQSINNPEGCVTVCGGSDGKTVPSWSNSSTCEPVSCSDNPDIPGCFEGSTGGDGGNNGNGSGNNGNGDEDGGSSIFLWIGILVAVIIVIILFGVFYYFYSKSGNDDDDEDEDEDEDEDDDESG